MASSLQVQTRCRRFAPWEETRFHFWFCWKERAPPHKFHRENWSKIGDKIAILLSEPLRKSTLTECTAPRSLELQGDQAHFKVYNPPPPPPSPKKRKKSTRLGKGPSSNSRQQLQARSRLAALSRLGLDPSDALNLKIRSLSYLDINFVAPPVQHWVERCLTLIRAFASAHSSN